MKTNYKQSQAAPHAKPIFTVSRNDSTLYVLPAYLAGAVMIRLQHIADGDKVKKLCCKVKNDRLMAMEQDVPQGNVTLTAVDIISPEKCAEKGYRKDGYGYVRTLLVTPTAEHRAMFSITCTLGERDAEGHICSCGEYYHIEQMELTEQEVTTMLAAVRAAAAAAEQEADEILARKQNVQRKNCKRQAVAKA